MPWDMNVPRLDSSVVGQPELYEYLEKLRRGIGGVMGGATEAHTALHAETAAAQATASSAAAAVQAMSATMAILTSTLQQTLLGNAALSARLSAVEARSVRVVSARTSTPSLALGVAKVVDLAWSPAASSAPQGVELFVEPTGSLLGQVTASLVPGSVTAAGCQVRLVAPLALASGVGSVHVVGWLWT